MVQISNDDFKKPRSERVRRRADNRRLEILRAASTVFRKHGVAGANMRQIAAAADLSPGNLYYYFKGKDEIVYFCQDRTLDRLLAVVESARSSGRAVADQLRSIIDTHLRIQLDELEGSAAHLEIDALPQALRERLIAKRDSYEHAIRALVNAGIDGGEFLSCDAKLVTLAILGAINWTSRWFRPDGAQTAAAVAAAMAEYLVGGLVGGVSNPSGIARAVDPAGST